MSLLAHWLDGVQGAPLAVDDRGAAYGDGLFESILWCRGRAVWWAHHIRRLSRDALRLGIAPPKPWSWQEDLDFATAWLRAEGCERAVLRLTLTRGRGGRGYAPPEPAEPMRMLQIHDAPSVECAQQPLALMRCRIRLATQPALAGMKHLNRLEQVIARRECSVAKVDEGLMFDAEGALVCSTMGNVLLHLDGRWLTPPIERAGVAGIARDHLIRHGLASEQPLHEPELARADALAVCNSVRGILPVGSLDGQPFDDLEETRALQQALHDIEPSFLSTVG